MARPTTKDDLIQAANSGFERLWQLIDTMTPALQNASFAFDDRDKNLRDVLVHVYHWHLMLKSWHAIGTLEGGMPKVPGDGYTWRTLPALNMEIWKNYQAMPLSEAKEKLKESHLMIMAYIAPHTNEELFAKGQYKWTKSSTLCAYFVSATASHYDWAMKKIKKHIKSAV